MLLRISSSYTGAGFGTYLSVDFALVMDVLKNKQDHAKDIAVWHQVSLARLTLTLFVLAVCSKVNKSINFIISDGHM